MPFSEILAAERDIKEEKKSPGRPDQRPTGDRKRYGPDPGVDVNVESERALCLRLRHAACSGTVGLRRGRWSVFAILLSAMIAAGAMSLSSVLPTADALRLRRVQL